MVRIRLNQAVAEALVVALAVVMRDEVLSRCAQRTLAKNDQPFQARFFYAPNESLGVRIQIRTPRWQLHGFHASILERTQKRVREQWIPIMDQVMFAREQTLDGIGYIPGNLAHPQAVRGSRNSGYLHAPGR